MTALYVFVVQSAGKLRKDSNEVTQTIWLSATLAGKNLGCCLIDVQEAATQKGTFQRALRKAQDLGLLGTEPTVAAGLFDDPEGRVPRDTLLTPEVLHARG